MFLVMVSRSRPSVGPVATARGADRLARPCVLHGRARRRGLIILGGPLADEHRVAHVVEAKSEQAIRATLARDPWSGTHLRVETIEPWTIRLDGRRA